MDIPAYKKLQCEHTWEHVLKKIDHILDQRDEEGGHLDRDDIECLKMCWKILKYAKEASA